MFPRNSSLDVTSQAEIQDEVRALFGPDTANDFGLFCAGDPFEAYLIRGERVAAITRSAERVFFRELHLIPDPNERDIRWDELNEAQEAKDYLREHFDCVLPHINGQIVGSDEQQFKRRLRAKLGILQASFPDGSPWSKAWKKLDAVQRDVLLEALYVFLLPLGALLRRDASKAGAPIPHVELTELHTIAGWFHRAGGLALFGGSPGDGKSWLLVMLSCLHAKPAGVSPEKFCRRAVPSGTVLYFAAEGHDGVAHRVRAWEKSRNDGEPLANLHIYKSAPPLSSFGDSMRYLHNVKAALPEDSPPVVLIVIDTLRKAMDGAEDKSDDMKVATTTAAAIGAQMGCPVAVAHHLTKGTRTLRGSGELEAAADFIAILSPKLGDVISFVTDKVKNGVEGERFSFELRRDLTLEALNPSTSNATAYGREQWAAEITRAIISLKSVNPSGMIKRDVAAAVAADAPGVFGDDVPARTASDRVGKGLAYAVEKGWIIAPDAKGTPRYRVGPVAPPIVEFKDL
jgi:hypothetical protein